MAGKDIIDTLASPVVPISAGVPAVMALASPTRASAKQYSALASATIENAAIEAGAQFYDALRGIEWGLFDQNGVALFPDALVLQIGGSLSASIANAPLEAGSFVSYNKVDTPDQIQLGLSFQGSVAAKAAQFAALEALKKGTDLVTVRMPETTRLNMNVTNISFQRDASSGADLLMPTVVLQEVRAFAATTYTVGKRGTTSVTTNRGVVQAVDATTAQAKAIGRAA